MGSAPPSKPLLSRQNGGNTATIIKNEGESAHTSEIYIRSLFVPDKVKHRRARSEPVQKLLSILGDSWETNPKTNENRVWRLQVSYVPQDRLCRCKSQAITPLGGGFFATFLSLTRPQSAEKSLANT